jgi:hypothetical protein
MYFDYPFSLPLSHPYQPNPQFLPILSPDWWPLVWLSEPFSLIKAICVSVGLEVSTGTWQYHQWGTSRESEFPVPWTISSKWEFIPIGQGSSDSCLLYLNFCSTSFIATDLRIYHIQPQTKCRVYDSSVHETWLDPGRAYGEICHLDICQLSPCACAKESDFCLLKTYEPERSTLISCLMWHSVCN